MSAFTRISRLYSSYNNPFAVAIVDTVTVFALCMLTLMGSTALHNATAPDGWSMSLDYGAAAIGQGIIALIMGGFSFANARAIQNRPYLVRSVGRTIWTTTLSVTVLTGGLWVVFSAYAGEYDPLTILDALGLFGWAAAPFALRMFGFVDPNGIGKLLREGKTNEAHVVMAATAASRGLTWISNEK